MRNARAYTNLTLTICAALVSIGSLAQHNASAQIRPVYGGRAVVLEFTNENVSSGFVPILIGDTGELRRNGRGTNLFVPGTNISTVIVFDGARATTRGKAQQALSTVVITNFDLVFTPPGRTAHRLEFDRMEVRASATCVRTGVVLRSRVFFDNLMLDGNPINYTGATNQVIPFDGGQLLLNAQVVDPSRFFGTMSVASIFLDIENDVSGPIGLAEAVIDCGEDAPRPPEGCDRVFGAGVIADRGNRRIANFNLAALTRNGQMQGRLQYYDVGLRRMIRSDDLVAYQINPDRSRELTFRAVVNGEERDVIVVTRNNRQRGFGTDRITVSVPSLNYTADSAVLRGTIQNRECQ